MPAFPKTLMLLIALGVAAPLAAQEAAAPEAAPEEAAPAAEAPAAEAAPAAAAEAIPEPYIKESFDAWQLRCVKTAEGQEPCQLYQLLMDKENNKPIMEITMVALPEGGDAIAGATVIVPLETLLTQKLNVTVDSAKTKRFDFTFCAEVGCVARLGLTKDDLDAFRKGNVATISVVPVADPTRTVDVDLSLKGFTAGYEAVTKANQPKSE